MKTTELMIGDKVLVKVLSQILDTYVVHAWTAEDYFRDLLQIKPIPLTAEILEKNGFKMVKYDGWVHYYEIPLPHSALPFVIHSMIGGEMLSNEIDEYSTSTKDNNGIDIKYVHELQHVLRLCRMSVLADNFRVN